MSNVELAAPADPLQPTPPPASGPSARVLTLVVATALFMEALVSTVIATSLAAMAQDLQVDPLTLKLAFTAYFVMWWTNGYHDLLNLPRMDLLPYADRLALPSGQVYILATTIFFASVVCAQVGAAYACRTERASVFSHGMFSNRFLLLGIAFELGLACVLMYVPLFQNIFELGPLPWQYWCLIIFWAPTVFLAEEGRKAVMRWWEGRPARVARPGVPVVEPSIRRR